MATTLSGAAKVAWLYGLATGSLLVDQLTKTLVRENLNVGQVVALAPGFNLRHVFNKGGAFSLLYGNVWFLAAVAFGVTLGLIIYERRHPAMPRWQAVGLGILLGGTLGNMIDRVVRGQVTDFLDVYVGAYHWPTFNVADICINLGVAMLVLGSLLTPSAQEDIQR